MRELSKNDIQQIEIYYNDLINGIDQKFEELENIRIKNAITVAYDAHYSQIRKVSKEPYIQHPLAVAKIVCNEIGFGSESAVCAILHDVVEDSKGRYTVKDLEGLFGSRVANVVQGLTKITGEGKKNDLPNSRLSSNQLESLKKVSLKSISDVRVIYIKIADRVHNMRTMEGMGQNSKLRKAGENLMFYSPFAYRLGLYNIKKELEDGSFKINNLNDYNVLNKIIKEEEEKKLAYFNSVKSQIEEKLKTEEKSVDVEYFTKSHYSTWKKMEEKKKPFDEIYNYKSIRVIFDPPTDISMERRIVYMLFVEITNLFPERKNSLRDYIKEEKVNGFQAIVFDIIAQPPLTFIEIQIMSRRMQKINDMGPLSVKDKLIGLKKTYRQKWIEKLNQQLNNELEDPLDFINDLANQFQNEIIVYTPKGEPIRLPRGSTVLDFAFSVHTEIGTKCLGAIVDNEFAKITYILHGGQRVDIQKAEEEVIQEYWIDYVITKKAKDCIRSFSHKKRNKIILKGREIFNTILNDAGIQNRIKALEKLVRKYDLNKNEIFFRIGENSITKENIYRNLINPLEKASKGFWQTFFKRNTIEVENKTKEKEIGSKHSFLVDEHLIYTDYFIAHCCNPIPGDDAVIYRNKHGAFIIHQTQCPQATQFFATQGKNAVNVKWMEQSKSIFPTKLIIRGKERKGLIRDITELISSTMDINMHSINIKIQNRTQFIGDIILFVKNKEVLDDLTNRILKIDGIQICKREIRFEMDE